VIRPQTTFGWAREFLNRGARGIVAPEIDITDGLAAAFAKSFYAEFLKGTPLGLAVRTARLRVLETEHNPLGLAYTLYASPHVRIVH
jgi:CHAT domain-containing protein